MSIESPESVTIAPNGVDLDCLVFRPEGEGPHPCVIMAHGYGALKEMSLTTTAESFAEAGFGCVVYDHRNLGKSGGHIRQEIDPWEQIKDMRGVITYAQTIQGFDSNRIALWGTSFAAGEVIVVSAVDRRVKASIAQVPFVSGSKTVRAIYPASVITEMMAKVYDEKKALLNGSVPLTVPISEEGSEGNLWAKRAGKGTSYRNEMTLQSLDHVQYFEPIDFVHRIAPTPLLMMVAKADTRTPTELQLEAFEKAREPKEMVWLEGGHYDPYEGQLEIATQAAIDFLGRSL